MKLILNLYWRIFGFPETPPKYLLKVIPRVNQYTLDVYYPRSYAMAILYKRNLSIEDISQVAKVTRERVRQCLWKVYREM